MSDPKRVIIVDDNYEIIDYLENALSLLEGEVSTVGVPSAEEAWLELLREKADLMLVDLRLPGIDGSELMGRVQKRHPDLPVIVISGFDMEIMKQATAGLTVYRLLEKPLDTDKLLEIVSEVLYGKPHLEIVGAKDLLSADERERLERLQVDTAARQLVLASLGGKHLFESGDDLNLLDVDLLAKIGASIQNGLTVARHLATDEVQAIQFFATAEHEYYFANAGQNYFLALAFEADSQENRIGTVWGFLQAAIRELAQALPEIEEVQTEVKRWTTTARPDVVSPAVAPALEEKEEEPEPSVEVDVPLGDPLTLEEALAQGLLPDNFSMAEDDSEEEFDLFGDLEPDADDDLALLMGLAAEDDADGVAGESGGESSALDADFDLDLLEIDDDSGADEDDLDAFWDAAVTDLAAADDSGDSRLSLEDARRRGMVPDEGNEL